LLIFFALVILVHVCLWNEILALNIKQRDVVYPLSKNIKIPEHIFSTIAFVLRNRIIIAFSVICFYKYNSEYNFR